MKSILVVAILVLVSVSSAFAQEVPSAGPAFKVSDCPKALEVGGSAPGYQRF